MSVPPKRWRGPYGRQRCADPPPELLVEGIRQFNRGEYFEQHETLEALWRSEPEDIRYLYQGILLVGVGLYHLRHGNHHGAVSKLRGGLDKLQWFLPTCQGVDVARLVEDTTRCLEGLIELGPGRRSEFDVTLVPKVHAFGTEGS